MDLGIVIPDSLCLPASEIALFKRFLQEMANRRGVGFVRYGSNRHSKGYMTRMKKELDVYKRSGNHEQLLNIAVYAFLESHCPENEKYHFDNAVGSVTRKPKHHRD